MRTPLRNATVLLCAFFVLTFVVAFFSNRHYPAYALAGEASAGTWMSGVLLVVSATLSLIVGMRHQWFPWFLVTAFFLLLAADERFMLHERLKERLVFAFFRSDVSNPMVELPVMIGACVGAWIAYWLWRHMHGISRALLIAAVSLGTLSVVFDVLAAGVLWEEGFKLLAELSIVMALLRKTDA